MLHEWVKMSAVVVVRAGVPHGSGDKAEGSGTREPRNLTHGQRAGSCEGERVFLVDLAQQFSAMIAFIDDHRRAHGVERICRRVLPVALSAYPAHVAKRVDHGCLPVTDGTLRLKEEVRRVVEANFRGLRHPEGPLQRQLQREDFDVASPARLPA